MPRLFIGIELPEPVKDLLTHVRGDIDGASWSKRSTYHVTLRFLGDQVPSAQVAPITTALNDVRFESFELLVQGVGRFPPNSKRAARVLWAGIAAPRALDTLYAQIERALIPVGFPAEDRSFHPHVTLARLRESRPDPAVDQFLDHWHDLASDPTLVDRFVLYESVLAPGGPQYTARAIFKATNN
ncbi:MAG: RNA 2',3'-cyclic phosphodiesterase [Anaerolineae bacterium]|nr:RNA 2',3'-cyclic phosphodiesterase [Anaerolineae bacterium]